MENFAIILSVPAAFAAACIYALLARPFLQDHDRTRRAVIVGSVLVLELLAIELILILRLGIVGSRLRIGTSFESIHLATFFLAVPALANLLHAARIGDRSRSPVRAAVACAIFALPLVVFQYAVSEALYGLNGDSGPFSSPKPAILGQ